MTVADLIIKLIELNQKSTIYLHDSYYDTIESFVIKKIDSQFYTLPKDATNPSYWIEWENEKP